LSTYKSSRYYWSRSAIDYVETALDIDDPASVQLSPDGEELLWTVSRPDPGDAPVFRMGDPAGSDADVEMRFASPLARAPYEGAKGDAEHARILKWTQDGSVALVETSRAAGYGVDAVMFDGDRRGRRPNAPVRRPARLSIGARPNVHDANPTDRAVSAFRPKRTGQYPAGDSPVALPCLPGIRFPACRRRISGA
jgi:hypothetical protein